MLGTADNADFWELGIVKNDIVYQQNWLVEEQEK